MIEINDIAKDFEDYTVLSSCSFKGENKIYGLLGRNGAGKTTLFKILLGLLTPSKGNVKICGKNPIEERQQVLRLVGATIEQPKFYCHLSAFDNLSIHLSYMGFHENEHKRLIEEVLSFVGLTNAVGKKVSKYSLGMKQRLAIARAIIHKPKVLILDEPMNGLDPIGIKDLREILQEVAKEGTAILVSSHNLAELQSFCTKYCIIKNGEIIDKIDINNLQEGESLEEIFIRKVGDNEIK